MSNIDERIVEMKFNNKQFESGVETSLSTLDKLKKALNLDASARSLSDLEKASSKFSMESLSGAVENISSKFSALGIIGITALQNITNTAIDAGKRIAYALTIDPVKTGLAEYETKMNAIQTILTNTASKGTTLDDVNRNLAELNEYADKTIYNFAEMTRNIGTFTAAGIDLDVATASIKGIANLAAASGSSSQQASTAMYQLSQALSTGTLKLMDWNSVVNAGMGGELFQNVLKETAKEYGTDVDSIIEANGSFRDSLSEGWITSEILTTSLEKLTKEGAKEYTDAMIESGKYTREQAEEVLNLAKLAEDSATQVKTATQLFDTMKESVQSGWAVSWENIIGDKAQSTELLTSISAGFEKLVGPAADARNAMLKFWNVNGGRDMLIEALSNAFNGLMDVIKPIKEAFRELFPAMTGERLVALTEKFLNLTKNFKMGDKTSENLKKTFKGLFAILDIGKTLFSSLFNVIKPLFGKLNVGGDGILNLTAKFGDYLVTLNDTIKANGTFINAFQAVIDFLKSAASKISESIGNIIDYFKSFSKPDLSGLSDFATSAGDAADTIRNKFNPVETVINSIKSAFEKIKSVIDAVTPGFKKFGEIVSEAFTAIKDKVGGALSGISFDDVIEAIKTGFFGALLISVAKFLKDLSGVFSSGSDMLQSIVGILDGVKDSLEAYQQQLKAGTLLKIAIAIGILAAAVIALTLVDPKKLGIALAAVTAMFVDLFASMAVFAKVTKDATFSGAGKMALGMIGMATAVLILSSAMVKLQDLGWENVAIGLTAITGLLTALVLAAQGLSTVENSILKSAAGLVVMGVAISLLIKSVSALGSMNPEQLIQGLVGIGLLIGELVLFMKGSDLDKLSLGQKLGFVALASAIKKLAEVVEIFGTLDRTVLTQGLLAVGSLLTMLGLFAKLSSDASGMIATAVGLAIVSGAMFMFVKIIKDFGAMDMTTIGKGLMTLAGSLAIVAIALNAMNGTLAGAAALMVVAGALMVLTPILKAFGSMSLESIGKSLLMLAGVFTVIGLAGLILAPLVVPLLGLAAAIVLLGAGCLAAGVGVSMFAAGLAALAISGVAGAGALVVIVTSLLSLIPLIIKKFGEGLILFAKVIADGGPAITEAITTVLLSFVESIVTIVPAVADAFLLIMNKIIEVLVELTPKVVDTLLFMLTTLLEKIAEYLPDMIQAGMDILIGFLKGITDNIEEVVATGIDIVVNFLNGIASRLGDIIQAGVNMILSFLDGVANAIRNNKERARASMKNLISAMIEAAIYNIKESIKDFKAIGKKIIESGFLQGIRDKIFNVNQSLKDLVSGGIQVIRDQIFQFKNIGKDVIDGFINGIKSKINDVGDAASSIGKKALNSIKSFLGINSPSKVFFGIGKNTDEGFIGGLKTLAGKVGDTAKGVGQTAVDSLSKPLTNLSDVLDIDVDANPTIRPILDLSDVEAGSKTMNSMLGKDTTLAVDTSNAEAAKAAIASKVSITGQLSKEVKDVLGELKDSFNDGLEALSDVVPQINFNGTYAFNNQEDIDYFMNQAAVLIQRRMS